MASIGDRPISPLPQQPKRAMNNEEHFKALFETSSPDFEYGHWERDFQAETTKLETFLEHETRKKAPEHDLVYVCVGAARIEDQLFPGFVQKAVPDKKVLTLAFEWGGTKPNYFDLADGFGNDAYWRDNFSAQQFLCGLPDPGMKTAQDPGYDHGENRLSCWQSKQMLNHTVDLFKIYLQNQLKAGKQVVLSQHIDLLKEDMFIVKLYNSLLERYPNQLHFFVAYKDQNKITNQHITEQACKDLLAKQDKGIWHYHANLQDCTEPTKSL